MKWVMAVCLAAVGCKSVSPGPYEPGAESGRNTVRAQELSREGADKLDSDPAAAERLLRDALAADIFYGPAHNNLGVLYLKQGKLYEAASELEWARRLMPGHPSPRMNLALTLEKAGKYDEAIQGYEAALAVYPNHIETEQALARLAISSGRANASLIEALKRIAIRGTSKEWRDWAQQELLCRGSTP